MVSVISSATNKIFCHYGQYFAHLPPKNLRNLNFENMKMTLRDIIILHKGTKTQDHMLCYSYAMPIPICYAMLWCMLVVVIDFRFGQFFALLIPPSPLPYHLKK